MMTRVRYGMAVVAGLLLASCLFAGQASDQSVVTAGMLLDPGLTAPAAHSRPGSLLPGIARQIHDNDVGVLKITWPGEACIPFGDRIFPRGKVQNFGSQTQTNIPVICVIFDSAAGARVYGPETVYVARIDSGCVDTVAFPSWRPPTQEKVYFDTMTTALPGDEDTSNDWKAGRFTVAVWGEGHLTYNDGTFENAIAWVLSGSEMAERFAAPKRPLTLDKAVLWFRSFSGDDYSAEVRVYANDGPGGSPGTQLGTWAGQLHTDTWPAEYRNEVSFDPPIVVDCDTFFVSWYATEEKKGGFYIYLAYDTISDTIHIGNDWGKYNGGGPGSWGIVPWDASSDLGIDAYYQALLLDGSAADIPVPQGQIDSNTTFTPQVVVKNVGLVDRDNIPVKFSIVRNPAIGNPIYSDSANTGPVAAGHEVTVTFSGSVKPTTGNYTMTCITLLPFDGRTGNDTLVRPLTVGNPGIAERNGVAALPSVSIAPNPLGRLATVRYALPRAGLVTLDVYDATGRGVMSKTIAAKPVGTVSLDLRKLEAGVYVVRVKADGFSATQKLVVER
ncbi:MAG TPA: T9SS type A sorting domain-containing protein [bacterium]|nr:T9SS type A sorting domain-containing protein [bacterium]